MTDRHANKYLCDEDMQPIINATDVISDKQTNIFQVENPYQFKIQTNFLPTCNPVFRINGHESNLCHFF